MATDNTPRKLSQEAIKNPLIRAAVKETSYYGPLVHF